MFERKKANKMIGTSFSSRREAFSSILALKIEEGMDPVEAARIANEFADIYAKNMGMPEVVEPERKGADKVIYNVDKIVTYIESHPKAADILLGIASFGIGLFTGNATNSFNKGMNSSSGSQGQQDSPEQQQEPIDFSKID